MRKMAHEVHGKKRTSSNKVTRGSQERGKDQQRPHFGRSPWAKEKP